MVIRQKRLLDTIDIVCKCPRCESVKIITVDVQEYSQWKTKEGKCIQEHFPHLSDSDRERLKSGFCTPCWDFIFAD